MAIVQNFWLKGASKRLAGAVIYEAMGQTRARQLASTVTNPRTEAQMSQRIRWANLVAFYRANQSWMKYAFETKKQNQSEYNKFMSVNVSSSPIALTKSAAAAGACVVAPYIVTQGSLPPVEWQDAGSSVKSNIFLGSGKTFANYTTVGEFAQDLILFNPALREGDQLSLIRFSQLTNSATGFPYIIVRKYEVLLQSNSTEPLNNYIPTDYLEAPGLAENNAIYVTKESRQGGFVLIISRTTAGKTFVSTQSVVIVNNEQMISQYSSPAAIAEAIASYGESTEAFLSTVSATPTTVLPIANTINYAELYGTAVYPGGTTANGHTLSGKGVKLVFTSALPSTATISSKVVFTGNGHEYVGERDTIQGNAFTFTIPSGIETDDYDEHIRYIAVTIDGVEYRITFAARSEYSEGGE